MTCRWSSCPRTGRRPRSHPGWTTGGRSGRGSQGGALALATAALLARRITAECLPSVGLMDVICPPSTVFAAYNEIGSAKDIAVYPYSGHSVPHAHAERQLRHLRATFPA